AIFLKALKGAYEGVVMMYHDQGQIATKLLGFHQGVTVTAGLGTIYTTPAHGAAVDITGEGEADTGALESAVRIGAQKGGGGGAQDWRSLALVRRRQQPLPSRPDVLLRALLRLRRVSLRDGVVDAPVLHVGPPHVPRRVEVLTPVQVQLLHVAVVQLVRPLVV